MKYYGSITRNNSLLKKYWGKGGGGVESKEDKREVDDNASEKIISRSDVIS